ncbi:MAG: DoxX family membrane protein [Saprospiraceae bacterium]|nr:DoxX family membrane protein [Saprospiraceae bacterium]
MSLKQRVSSYDILAISIGIVYLWFGALKFFPGISPAEDLAKDTISALTFHLIPASVSIILLAIWETMVGVLLIFNLFRRQTILFALIHMVCTFTPLFLFPDLVFNKFPFQLTFVGQYIFKNLIIIAALLSLRSRLTR